MTSTVPPPYPHPPPPPLPPPPPTPPPTPPLQQHHRLLSPTEHACIQNCQSHCFRGDANVGLLEDIGADFNHLSGNQGHLKHARVHT